MLINVQTVLQQWLAQNNEHIGGRAHAVLSVLAYASSVEGARKAASGLLNDWDGEGALAERCAGLADLCRIIDARFPSLAPTTTPTDAGDAGGRK